jgi:alkaline phosphatase isozyme conversion protein
VKHVIRSDDFMTISKHARLFRLISLGLFLVLLFTSLSACTPEEEDNSEPARFGLYGSDFARRLAHVYPFRSPGSTQEKAAGDLIIKELEKAGFEPEIQSFRFADDEGRIRASRNIFVTLQGSGFIRPHDDGENEELYRQVIVGAHYDTFYSKEDLEAYRLSTEPTTEETTTETEEDPDDYNMIMDIPTLLDYNGIHDNASGIGALMLLARQLKDETFGYDVVLVAFGAGEAQQAGARAFVREMSDEDIEQTDVMYCMDSIYAGDKIYAHAGQNSVRSFYRKSYELRRKLYEVTDVFYEFLLYTHNDYMLYTNQSSIDVSIEGEGWSTPILYREWTFTESDYIPFDEEGIPIVFFESFDYDAKTLEDMKESKNPSFTSTGGAIRHTYFDSTEFLDLVTNEQRTTLRSDENDDGEDEEEVDHLTKRINNTVFLILESIKKGIHDAQIADTTGATASNQTETETG